MICVEGCWGTEAGGRQARRRGDNPTQIRGEGPGVVGTKSYGQGYGCRWSWGQNAQLALSGRPGRGQRASRPCSPAVCSSSEGDGCAASPCLSQRWPPAPGGPRLSLGQRHRPAGLSSAAVSSAAPSGGSFLPGPPAGDKVSVNCRIRGRGRRGQKCTCSGCTCTGGWALVLVSKEAANIRRNRLAGMRWEAPKVRVIPIPLSSPTSLL